MLGKMKAWILASLLLFVSTTAFSQEKDGKLKIGDSLPAFTLNSETYGNVSPADLKGKVVLVTLFATWCGPCQLELAEFQKTLYPLYKDNENFKLLVIGREHDDAALAKYNEKKKFSFPLYPDPDRKVFSLFADSAIPRCFLFNKDGKLIYSSLGYGKEGFTALMKMLKGAL